jgi:membrane protease YdiL (CAAX protease family)
VGAILLACFIGFLGGQVVALILESIAAVVSHYPGGLSELSKVADPPWWANALGLAGLWLGFVAAIVYAYREGGWRPRWSDLLFIVLGVACQLAIDVLYAPLHLKNLNRPVHHLFHTSHGASFVLIAVLTTLVAPFFEEWFFRGVLFRSIAEGTPSLSHRASVTLGVVGSAVLFGLAHGELEQFVGLALLGAVLALVVYRTKRLVPSFITHASFNATALVAVIATRAGH